MATCKDCIHYGICSLWSTKDLEEDEAYKYCFGNFKSAADVVEVVRCKDCEWWTKQKDSAQGRCSLLGIYPTGAWYCGNGRKGE